MPDLQKKLCHQVLPTAFPAEPGLYKANEANHQYTIIRSIHISSVQSFTSHFNLLICAPGGGDDWNRRLFSNTVVGPIGGFDFSCFIVMNTNEWLAGTCSRASQLAICISGVVVTS